MGVSYAESSYNNSPDKAWGVNVNYFVTPAVSVGASYVNANFESNLAAEADSVVLDTQTVGVNAKFRF